MESVEEAINCGVRVFGENRVQEAVKKFKNLKQIHKDIELHLTGPLQTNKVRAAFEIFDIFQTVDREKLALELSKFQDLYFKKKYFIQINIGKESTKAGILPELAKDFINYCKIDLRMPVVGLMCIPPIYEEPENHFLSLSKIAEENKLNELSMGMSADYEKGILAGATNVRVGTNLFGNRSEK